MQQSVYSKVRSKKAERKKESEKRGKMVRKREGKRPRTEKKETWSRLQNVVYIVPSYFFTIHLLRGKHQFRKVIVDLTVKLKFASKIF